MNQQKLKNLFIGVLGIYTFYTVGSIIQQRIMKEPYINTQENSQEYFQNSNIFILIPSIVCWIVGLIYRKYYPNQKPLQVKNKNWIISAVVIILGTLAMTKAIYLTNYPLVTLFKSCNLMSILVVAIFCSKVKDKKQRLGKKKLVIGLIVTIGVILYHFGNDNYHEKFSGSTSGILLLLFSLICDGLLPDIQAQIKTKYRPTAMQMFQNINKWKTILSFFYSIVTLEIIYIISFFIRHPKCFFHTIMLSFTGAIGQMFVYWLITHFRQHVVPFIITTRKIITVIISIFYFDHFVTKIQITGILLVFFSVLFDFKQQIKIQMDTNIKLPSTQQQIPENYQKRSQNYIKQKIIKNKDKIILIVLILIAVIITGLFFHSIMMKTSLKKISDENIDIGYQRQEDDIQNQIDILNSRPISKQNQLSLMFKQQEAKTILKNKQLEKSLLQKNIQLINTKKELENLKSSKKLMDKENSEIDLTGLKYIDIQQKSLKLRTLDIDQRYKNTKYFRQKFYKIPQDDQHYHIEDKIVVFVSQKKDTSMSSFCLCVNVGNELKLKMQSLGLIKKKMNFFQKTIFITNIFESQRIEEKLLQSRINFKKMIYNLTSKYYFLLNQTQKCKQTIFLQQYFLLNEKYFYKLEDKIKFIQNTQIQVAYSMSTQIKEIVNLSSIQNIEIEIVKHSIIIIKNDYLPLISPLNFGAYSHYTFNQMVLVPLMVLFWNSSYLLKLEERFHSEIGIDKWSNNHIRSDVMFKYKYFIDNQININCVLGHPSNSTKMQFQEFQNYLIPFLDQKIQNKRSIFLIITFLFSGQSLVKYLQLLKKVFHNGITVKIKIRIKKVMIALQVYNAAFQFCPLNSTIITSRYNIKFTQKIFEPLQLCEQKDKYILIPAKQRLNVTNIQRSDRKLYQAFLKNCQFLCSNSIRHLWINNLKHDEVAQFYTGQFGFIFPLIQIFSFTSNEYKYFDIFKDRNLSTLEEQQYKIFLQRKQINDGQIQSPFNSLQNPAYKWNRRDVIPKILHQIYFSNSIQLSGIKKSLSETIKAKHPDYAYYLWTLDNITYQNFPYTYNVIKKIQENSKKVSYNMRAFIAGYLRIQALYNFGGIYLDLKFEAKKRLDPYLKYQHTFIWFTFLNSSKNDFINIKNVIPLTQNGFLSSPKGDSHLKFILEHFTTSDNWIFGLRGYAQGGRMTLGLVFDYSQLFTRVNFGSDFVNGRNMKKCVNPKILPNYPHQQFKFQKKNKTMNIVLPCNYNDGKYLNLYLQLAGSYGQRNY